MKIGFIGCVKSSLLALNTLLAMQESNIEVVAVITKRSSTFNTDHVDLSEICKVNNIPFHYDETASAADSLAFMKSYT